MKSNYMLRQPKHVRDSATAQGGDAKTTKVWNLMYVLGNTSKIVGDSENPQRRASALEGADTITKNGWRVWIEHHKTGERLYENEREKAARLAAQ